MRRWLVATSMREDMDKVIVERPRLGGGTRRPKGARKRERLALADCLPSREGYRRRWTSWEKRFNEHLGPLRRFLQSQVGRPWDKVYSEISRHLRLDSAVQSHVLDHLWDYVETHTAVVNGVVCNSKGEPLTGKRWRRDLLYVCPKSGLLKAVRHLSRKQRTVPAVTHVAVGKGRQWRRIDDVWYEIGFAARSAALPDARDVLLKRPLSQLGRWELYAAYGGDVYAESKRQLGKREARLAERRLNEQRARAGRHLPQ